MNATKMVALQTVCAPSSFLVVHYSNRILLHFIVLSSPILALERADLKNNNGFRFAIPKSIETDVNLPTKNIQFYPLLELHFAPRRGGHEKKMADSVSTSSKILKLMYKLFHSNASNFIPFFGPSFGPQAVCT